jgi:hypothetical protein
MWNINSLVVTPRPLTVHLKHARFRGTYFRGYKICLIGCDVVVIGKFLATKRDIPAHSNIYFKYNKRSLHSNLECNKPRRRRREFPVLAPSETNRSRVGLVSSWCPVFIPDTSVLEEVTQVPTQYSLHNPHSPPPPTTCPRV